MSDAEIDLINHKVDIYKTKKTYVAEQLQILIQDIKAMQFTSNNTQSEILKNIESIRLSMNNVFLHYEELNFLEQLDKDILETSTILKSIGKEGGYTTTNVLNKTSEIVEFITNYSKLKENFKTLSVNALTPLIYEVNTELSNFKRLRNIADTALTESIYNNAVKKYKKLEDQYRTYFYVAIFLTITISVIMFFSKGYLADALGNIEFWILKASILVVGITLISYFIKQSSHYQRLADQNYQTQVELQAFPSFMNNIPANEATAIRKELALKYFGKEIDGSPHKDLSNLISDQIKSSTELVKTATDLLKKQ